MYSTIFDNTPLINCMQEVILPQLVQEKREAPLRLWSVGCEIGDEALMLTLLLASQPGSASASRHISVFATDADPEVVRRARSSASAAVHLPAELTKTYQHLLQQDQEITSISPLLRKTLIFAQHSLLRQAPFPHLDLILCHTALSSFTSTEQVIILTRFAYALSPHSLLVLLSPGNVFPDPVLLHRQQDWPYFCYERTQHCVEPTTLTPARRYPLLFSSLPTFTVRSLDGASSPVEPEPPIADEITQADLEELQTTMEEHEAISQELEERTLALEQVQRDLEQQNRMKDDLLSLLSHELRTPLTMLFTTVQGMQRAMVREEQAGTLHQLPEACKLRMKETLETVVTAGRDINTLVTSLLDIARMHNDLFALTLRPCNLVELIERVIAERQQFTGRPIRLEASRPTIMGVWDEDRLRQVIQNLLDNALKYSAPSTEVKVKVREANPSSVTFSVHDKGEGISQEDIPHLFDRFYRGSQKASLREGLGLGLYIVSEVVKRHGGRIWMESTRGAGSTFFVTLPLHTRLATPSLPETVSV
ncbi:MAG TPA: ATP-binding protein [Ktedonobacteraceae bacterium]